MEQSNVIDLATKYKTLSTERLIEILAFDELTDLAKGVVIGELKARNVDVDACVSSMVRRGKPVGSNWRWLLVPLAWYIARYLGDFSALIISYPLDASKPGVLEIILVMTYMLIGLFAGLLSMLVLPKTGRNARILQWLFPLYGALSFMVIDMQSTLIAVGLCVFMISGCIGAHIVMRTEKETK